MTVATAAPVLAMSGVEAGYFRNDLVLDQVTLEVRPGVVTAVLGPNGSGKSTTLRVLAGFLTPRAGHIMIGDEEVTGLTSLERLERGVSLLPQGRSVFADLTVDENLRLGAWTMRRDQGRLQSAVDEMYDRYPRLQGLRSRKAGALSGGQARLLEFGRTLILDPQILLIDEPSVGLAPVLVDEVYDEIERLKHDGRTILLVDQNVQAAVDLADYVYTLAYGRNHLDGDKHAFEGELDGLIKQWLNL